LASPATSPLYFSHGLIDHLNGCQQVLNLRVTHFFLTMQLPSHVVDDSNQ
jgi:hypothetical protein